MDEARLAEILGRLGAPARFLLAVSGGGDSMALLHLAARLDLDKTQILAATVDHRLRENSRAEAEHVAAIARSLGISHAILSWTGEKPRTGVQSAARIARYRLLAEHAAQTGCEAILVAHTADDQAETAHMRIRRGSSLRGMAGFASDRRISAGGLDPVRVLRPFAGTTREELRASLAALGARWFEDPSNEDARFERIAVRKSLQLKRDDAPNPQGLVRAAAENRAVLERLAASEENLFQMCSGRFWADGAATIGAEALHHGFSAGLMARLIHAVGGAPHFVAEDGLSRGLEHLSEGAPATRGRTLITFEGGAMLLRREPGTVRGENARDLEAVLAPGATIVWDNRFIVSNPFDETVAIAPVLRPAVAFSTGTTASVLAPGIFRRGALHACAGDDSEAQGALRALAKEKFYERVERFN